MIRLIRFLITGSWHMCEFEIIKEVNIFSHASAPMPNGTQYISNCTTCGKIKAKTV